MKVELDELIHGEDLFLDSLMGKFLIIRRIFEQTVMNLNSRKGHRKRRRKILANKLLKTIFYLNQSQSINQ
jgi:hypothetical protein